MERITFVTGNPAKVEKLARLLAVALDHQALDLPELQSLDLEFIVQAKAKEAYRQLGRPVLVEDVSLTFHALKQLPGPFIKWFLKSMSLPDICKLLEGQDDRSATARVCYALYDGKEMHLFDGQISGTIPAEPRGDNGFGWDPIFIPDGLDKTLGELTPEEHDQVSMRHIAIEKLEKYFSL